MKNFLRSYLSKISNQMHYPCPIADFLLWMTTFLYPLALISERSLDSIPLSRCKAFF